MKASLRFRALLESPETALVPLGALPIHAQMAEHAGFQAFQLSGGMTSMWLYGMPDIGLVTLSEMVDHAARVIRVVDIPVYCDADTGYGSEASMRRTTLDFLAVGAAGIHVEDQADPKSPGGGDGITVVSADAAVARVRAAVEARNEVDPDFVIVARTDAYGARGGGDVEEVINRGNRFLKDARADAVFIEGLATWDEAAYALREIDGPAYVIPRYATAGATPSLQDLTAMGQVMMHFLFILPGVAGAYDLLLSVQEAGSLASIDEYRGVIKARLGELNDVGPFGDRFLTTKFQ